ncbi:MAG: RNA polymerase sigma-70 factor [Ignavibacteriaceae bacterium]|nr:RNA polymerase sigma-70 factor [Ignavibacteriaceae bacterium]
MLPDEEETLLNLIELIKNDDKKAFQEFFYLYQPGIFHFLYRYTSDTETAKDLTQETFIRFWLHRRNLQISRSTTSYLYKTARNLAINYSIKSAKTSRIDDQDDTLLRLSLNPELEYDAVFFMDDYQKAIEKLPERCRATFILSRFSGFDYSEIAEILGVSLQTVKNQMNKALSVLKNLLAVYLN